MVLAISKYPKTDLHQIARWPHLYSRNSFPNHYLDHNLPHPRVEQSEYVPWCISNQRQIILDWEAATVEWTLLGGDLLLHQVSQPTVPAFPLLTNSPPSGLLTSYVVIKYTYGEYKNFGYISFFVLRYLRLTPQLGIFLLFSSMVPPLFDGPIWNSYISKMSEKCYVSWWRNLIYVHNLFDLENIVSLWSDWHGNYFNYLPPAVRHSHLVSCSRYAATLDVPHPCDTASQESPQRRSIHKTIHTSLYLH